jgi:predicted RNA-binding Zn ribbon-like protein
MQQTPALLIADAKALNFLNSVATPLDVPVEWLADGARMVSWLAQARLVAAPELERVRKSASPGELDRIAGEARELREWFRGFVAKHRGRPLTRQSLGELAPLNRLLERDESFAQIRASTDPDRPFEMLKTPRGFGADTLLIRIAETLALFSCTADFSLVKACEGPACTLLFDDRTQGHRRRWCNMALCGNRAKQAAHRNRSKRTR